MCDIHASEPGNKPAYKTIRVTESVGTVLAHDVTEIRPGEFKGRAFKKGHIIREEDVCHLQRLGKEHLFVLQVAEDEMHENDAAYTIAGALMGDGVAIKGEPKEGKISIIAERDGLLKINRDTLLQFNMLGDVMCATLHDNTVVKKGQVVAGTRAIPLVVRKSAVDEAVRIAATSWREIPPRPPLTEGGGRTLECAAGVIMVKELRKPKAGVVITGNEVYHGRIKDAFAPIITKKIEEYGGEIVGIYYAPDDEQYIEDRLRELLNAGADLLIASGGMSVDPDDVTRFAIRNLGATDITYGSAVLPGAMFLVAYLDTTKCGVRNTELEKAQTQDAHSEFLIPNSELIPVLGIPAC
ncbi:MAG: molybdopterin-binding protein, partial [Syntrophales bacterium]|nr:molybdopterin-binding protein [Syntrophales bacterium]